MAAVYALQKFPCLSSDLPGAFCPNGFLPQWVVTFNKYELMSDHLNSNSLGGVNCGVMANNSRAVMVPLLNLLEQGPQ